MQTLTPSQRSVSFLAVLFTCALQTMAWAYSVKPGVQILREKPGKKATVSFEIHNDDKTPLILTLGFRDAFVNEENKDFPVASWLKPVLRQVVIPPNGTKNATLEINVPQKAKGELGALISFIPKVDESTQTASSTNGPSIQTRIVSMITSSLYVRVEGTERGEADLGEFKIKNVKDGDGVHQIQAWINVKNSGNFHLRPAGIFDIFIKGEPKPKYSFSFPSGWPTLPKEDTPYMAQTFGTLPAGDYRARAEIKFTPKTALVKETSFTVNLQGDATNFVEVPVTQK